MDASAKEAARRRWQHSKTLSARNRTRGGKIPEGADRQGGGPTQLASNADRYDEAEHAMSASARLSKGAAWEDLIAHYRHNEPGLMPVTPSSLMEEYCLPPASTEPIEDMVLDVKHLAEVLFGLPADASLQLDGIFLAGPSQPDDPAAEVPLQDRGTPAECSPQRNTAHPMSGEAQPCSGSDVPKPYHDAEAHAPNTDVRAPSTFAHAEARAPWELRHPTSAGMKADETAGARTVHQLAPAQAFPSNKEVAAHGGGSGADVQGSVAVKISAPEKSLEDWLNDL
ncbi:hypothetical protein ACKKBG_A07320 [Auxenochlorella protothecoides x Auxenochlorella symbiontica]